MRENRALELFERINAVLRDELRRSAAAHGLEPVHIVALWYISRANRFSDNPLAVAEFLGLTKGNVSQRLNVLEQKGMLIKRADPQDGRRIHLGLTARGRALLRAHYPPRAWPRHADLAGLETHLEGLLRAIVRANGQRTFGQCSTCRFHERRDGAFCGLLKLPLTPAQALQICREHEPKEAAAPRKSSGR